MKVRGWCSIIESNYGHALIRRAHYRCANGAYGASNGDRTRIVCLEGRSLTIRPYLHGAGGRN